MDERDGDALIEIKALGPERCKAERGAECQEGYEKNYLA